MTAPGTYSQNWIMRKLGVRTRLTPEYRVDAMTPVLIVADMSRSYAAEAIEGRAFAASDLLHNGLSVDWEIMARAPGGIVVEYIGIGSDLAGAIASFHISDTSLGLGAPLLLINIGGEAVISVGTRGFDTFLGGGWNWPCPFELPTERLYVPAGYYLQSRSRVPGVAAIQTAYFACVFREVPEQLGSP